MPIASVNPATNETLATFEPFSHYEIETRLDRAVAAFHVNRARSFDERARLMRRTADCLEQRKAEYGKLLTLEMGKPIKAALAEVEKCALTCRYYADPAASYLADEPVKTEAQETYIRYEPIGAVLAVMPWNFPFWQVFRFAAPALMAGDGALLIPADQVAALLDDERIRAATLTGSEPAGASVASAAAKQIKKSVLELGGSDPFVVMPSANLDEAVKIGIKARIVNNGQSCIAAKRFIVHEAIAGEYEKRFVDARNAWRVGDPLDESTDIGPLAMPQIVSDLEKQVKASVDAGAKLLTGGKRIGDRGNFYAPTVLTNLALDAPASHEETFGPVASMFRVRDVDEAITVANATTFGLGSSVWTNDRDEANRLIAGIESGQVFVNAMVASDPRVPFGGVKHSGFGRELGEHGTREFVNVKTVWIEWATSS